MMKIAVAFTFFFLGASNVQAQTSFFAGKTIRIIVGLPAGDVYDIYARRESIFQEIPASSCKICPAHPP
jgi:tripartite-type tricarboxylate transporter receptor subunit TctC